MYDPMTTLIHSGRPTPEENAPVNPNIVMSSTFRQTGPSDIHTYARFTNESWEGLEEVLGQLEGASQPGLLFASGMAAVASVLGQLPVGSHILLPQHTYMASVSLANGMQDRGIATVHRLNIEDTASVLQVMDEVTADLVRANEGSIASVGSGQAGETPSASHDPIQRLRNHHPVALLWVESPTNPMMEVADLLILIPEAKKRGMLVAIDNTFATPLGQNPLKMGANLVVHSATKAIAGHSDVLLGAVVAADPLMRELIHAYRSTHGAIPGPFEAWLGLRGIRTLGVRLQRSVDSTELLVAALSKLPQVKEVRYPGLATDPGHARAVAQMKNFGSMFTMTLDATAEQTDEFLRALKVWTPATSLGGVESLVERRRRHASEPESISPSLLRLSVGLEDPHDLLADLLQAFEVIA